MIWFILLPISILFELLAKILAPVLPLFATPRLGPAFNNNSQEEAPRLPTWLSWFDTPDNSLYGDRGWREEHCTKYWNTYLGMVLWLLRNSGVGFGRTVLAKKLKRKDISYEGEPRVSHDGPFGYFYANTPSGFWQLKKTFVIKKKVLQFNLGWQINTMIEQDLDESLCFYKMSIKIKDNPYDK
jgi:hypothetical protein